MPFDDPKPEPYVYQPYPAVRYHATLGPETVLDADHEITVCGEICDTKNGTANRLGWRNRPFASEELAPEPASDPAPKQEQARQEQKFDKRK